MQTRWSLLTEPIIRARSVSGSLTLHTLPSLFIALTEDQIQDFPALRPHQRHPWHALMVQLAALVRHHLKQIPSTEQAWSEALCNLSSGEERESIWCLVSPLDQPAFLQPPVPENQLDAWKGVSNTPDELDMLVTSKNHDLKAARMHHAAPDEWLFSLVSLQTQEGFLGAGNYGISRMNGGFASRPGIGVVPSGGIGRRWLRDTDKLLAARDSITTTYGLCEPGGTALVWELPWDGSTSLAFETLDPFYIEICRRVRLVTNGLGRILARNTGTKAARISASTRNGMTGDAWTPLNKSEGKALTITSTGFDYRLASELLFGGRFASPPAQQLEPADGTEGISVIAQGVTRGQGKTEGFHQRLIPISPKVRQALLLRQTDRMAAIASERVHAIGVMRSSILRTALFSLFQAGTGKLNFDSNTTKQQVGEFLLTFERIEDARFFGDLNTEVEASNGAEERLMWLLALAERAELILRNAFITGPQSGERRYKAQAAALSMFHGLLRSDKHLPTLANHFRTLTLPEETIDVIA
jgi:CRISPR system Cascade subunit CasA